MFRCGTPRAGFFAVGATFGVDVRGGFAEVFGDAFGVVFGVAFGVAFTEDGFGDTAAAAVEVAVTVTVETGAGPAETAVWPMVTGALSTGSCCAPDVVAAVEGPVEEDTVVALLPVGLG